MSTHWKSSLAAVTSLFLFSGCMSAKFNSAWKTAQASTQASSQASVQPRRWIGTWHSDRHNAGGRLRAVVGQPKEGRVDIYFEARWHGFTSAYPVVLSATETLKDGKSGGYASRAVGAREWRLFGEHNLKSLIGGGVYSYEGTLSSKTFDARYSSRYDEGTFRLEPAPEP